MTEKELVMVQAAQDQAWEALGDYAPTISSLLMESILNKQKEYTVGEQCLITTLVSTAVIEVVLRKCKKELEID
jgi:hypothetical protein